MTLHVFKDGTYKKIDDIQEGSTNIIYVYKNNVLVWQKTVEESLYCKKPNFSSITSFSNKSQFVSPTDGWLDVVYNSGDVNVYWSMTNASTSTPNIAYARQAGGISGSKGGSLVYIPKGSHILASNAGSLRFISSVTTNNKVPYSMRNKITRVPNWDTAASVSQNAVVQAVAEPRWLVSFGSTRKVEVSYDNNTWITIAEGVVSATVEPSAAFYIPAGCSCKTTGTSNYIYNCLKG